MWAAFKLLPMGAKLGIAIGLLIALASLVGSTYFIAYNKGLNVSKVAIANYERDVQKLRGDLKTAQGKVTVQVVTKYVKSEAQAAEIIYKNKIVLQEVVKPQFNLSKGWIYSYNQTVLGQAIDPILAGDSTLSNTKDSEALIGTIIPNVNIGHATKRQLDALQLWEINTEKAENEVINR